MARRSQNALWRAIWHEARALRQAAEGIVECATKSANRSECSSAAYSGGMDRLSTPDAVSRPQRMPNLARRFMVRPGLLSWHAGVNAVKCAQHAAGLHCALAKMLR